MNSISVPAVAGSAEADATRTEGRAAGANVARRPETAAVRVEAAATPRVEAARAVCIFVLLGCLWETKNKESACVLALAEEQHKTRRGKRERDVKTVREEKKKNRLDELT